MILIVLHGEQSPRLGCSMALARRCNDFDINIVMQRFSLQRFGVRIVQPSRHCSAAGALAQREFSRLLVHGVAFVRAYIPFAHGFPSLRLSLGPRIAIAFTPRCF